MTEKSLKEIFDSSYPVNIRHSGKYYKSTYGTFKKENGKKTNVELQNTYDEPSSSFVFYDADSKGEGTGKENDSPNVSHKVFSTALNVAKEHLKKYKHVNQLKFSVSDNEPSRMKLYHHMAKKIDPAYKYDNTGEFTVNASKLKESVDKSLAEIFDNPYPVDIKHYDDDTEGRFKDHNGTHVKVDVMKNRKGSHTIEFKSFNVNLGNHGWDQTHKSPHHAHKTFSTVKKVLHAHMEKYPQTSDLVFSADNKEPSRIKLFHHMAKNIDPDYKTSYLGHSLISSKSFTSFHMKAPKLKESVGKSLTEIFDSSYHVGINHEVGRKFKETVGKFRNSMDHDIEVSLLNHDISKESSLVFYNKTQGDEMGKTGMEGHHSHKTFSTVKNVIKSHLKKFPSIEHITFSSDGEPSRTKLYHHMAKNIDPDYKHEKFYSHTIFKVNGSKLKEGKSLTEIFRDNTIYYHGSASGDLRGGNTGLHLGTYEAATQALEARIGRPATGSWDGKREYGKTKLAGQKTMQDHLEKGLYHGPTGHNCHAPEHDYYPHEHPKPELKYANGDTMPHTVKPNIQAFHITGPMTNSSSNPHSDYKANGYMKASLKKGNAKRGFYYKNDAEDRGSISAVVPNEKHITTAHM